MRKVFSIKSLIFVLLFSGITNQMFAKLNNDDIETVIHLLDYIARDYSEGVQNGEIINEQEYIEMLEFSGQAYDLTRQGSFLPKKDQHLLNDLKKLKTFIQKKKQQKKSVFSLDK
jgi:high-affinity iron transporter